MKRTHYLTGTLATLLLLLLFSPAQAQRASDLQSGQRLAIPLSNPGQPGSLRLGLVRGTITVTGYTGNEVLIEYAGEGDDNQEREVTRDGLRRISSNGVSFEVTEDDNELRVSSVSPMHMRSIDFNISVPMNFSLHLSMVNGGELRVENVNGEMELSNVNGDITLVNIGGSVVANTVNGEITADFRTVAADKPMAFTTLNGEIDVTFPANVRMNAKMRSEWGEIFTDFDMNLQRNENQVNRGGSSGTYKVTVNNSINGTVNGGGPEYEFRSMRGDIYIRRRQ